MSSKTVNTPGANNATDSKTTTTTKTKYYPSSTSTPLKGGVILCQHGFLGNENTITPLFENLKNNSFSKDYNCYFCENVFRTSELESSAALVEIQTQLQKDPTSNVFVRTLFRNAQTGDVRDQADELFHMIKKVNARCPSAPIVVVGYSKGGVVNCKCAINHPGFIDKIVNIGTPHTDTMFQELIYIIRDKLSSAFGRIDRLPIVGDFVEKLVNEADNGIDKVLDGPVSYMNLQKEWNGLSRKPTTTLIAGSAIELNERESDFVVPRRSALAEDFTGIKNRFEVDEEEVKIDTDIVKQLMGDASCVLDALGMISQLTLDVDIVKIVEVLVDIIYNTIQNNGDYLKCFKLAHTKILGNDYILTHPMVCNKVFAGINA